MEAIPRERTEIVFEVGADRAHCHGCGREMLPRIIKSLFLGTRYDALSDTRVARTLAVCPHCCTVVQKPAPKPREKKAKKVTVFVWECVECGLTFPENEKLPKAIGPRGVTCRVCARCYGEVKLVEKQS